MMTPPCELSPELLWEITRAIRSIRYGSVHITVQDSHVIQIEKAEKIRMPRRADLTSGGRSNAEGGQDG